MINGWKQFITNAPNAGLFVVLRARGPPRRRHRHGGLPRARGRAGVEVGAKDAKMGQEGSRTADVTFTQVRVGADALVGGDGDVGYRAAMTTLARGRVHIAALAVGLAQRALDESVAYAATATQGGTPIGDFQLVQAMIADQQTGVMAGRRWCATRRGRGWTTPTGGSRRRWRSCSAPRWSARSPTWRCRVHGGTGYMREVPVERIYRDVRLLRLYEGTSEIQRLIIGGALVRQAQKNSS